ncbi:MAG: hypothetical protein BWY85_00813 [Firmicutes bacterium ADurb.Bin506]|nr:MAG: hypothetical protein BWY85_00813 [Firmicutes bacterium ADurb.Bin506]
MCLICSSDSLYGCPELGMLGLVGFRQIIHAREQSREPIVKLLPLRLRHAGDLLGDHLLEYGGIRRSHRLKHHPVGWAGT